MAAVCFATPVVVAPQGRASRAKTRLRPTRAAAIRLVSSAKLQEASTTVAEKEPVSSKAPELSSDVDPVLQPRKTGGFIDAARSVFVPAGWPETVTPDYGEFSAYNVGRNAFRKANYVLGTTALLYALGLGTTEALAVSAAVKWVLKDGLGMLVKVSLSAQIARILDRDPKLFRVLGDTIMVGSVAVELASPLRPEWFLLFGSLASLLRQAADAMSGPSYRVFLNSFAISSNIGDVSSRGESQVVSGNVIGLGVGAAVSSLIGLDIFLNFLGLDKTQWTLIWFGIFSAGHLFCVQREVAAMELRTLNWKRLQMVVQSYIRTGNVPSVETVNNREPLMMGMPGTRMNRVNIVPASASDPNQPPASPYESAVRGRTLRITLAKDISVQDGLQAALQAAWLDASIPTLKKRTREALTELNEKGKTWAETKLPDFEKGLAAKGWSTEKLLLGWYA